MEDSNTVDHTPEYVVQLGQGEVLQREDLEGIVNLAVANSKSDQIQLYSVASEEDVEGAADGPQYTTETRTKQSLAQENLNLEQDTYQTKFIESIVDEENIKNNSGMTNFKIIHADEATTEPNMQGTIVVKNVSEEQVVRELTELGSETSVTSTNTTDLADMKEIKASKRRKKNLLNKRLANSPKQSGETDKGFKAAVNEQLLTAERLKSRYPVSRAPNRSRTIYDYLMYKKYPEGYTRNQKQALRENQDNYIIIDKKLYYRQKKNGSVSLLLVIHDEETDLQLEILRDGHMTPTGSHLGINRTTAQIREYFYWYGLTEHVREFIKSCVLCSLKQTVSREKDKLVQHGMKCDSNSGKAAEALSRSERVQRLSDELRRYQNNPSPYESKPWLQKLKDEVLFLNYSVSLHKLHKQSRYSESPRVISNKISSEDDISNHSNSDVTSAQESVCPDSKGDNQISTFTKGDNKICASTMGDNPVCSVNIIVVTGEDESLDMIKVDGDTTRKEKSSKEEELKMLESMLPRNREHNNSRLIEEIIRTNKYPKELTPGQIIGLSQVKTHYIMINDDLYRVFSKQGKMQNVAKVIHDDQPDLKRKIMKVYHVDECGKHIGMNKTISKLNETFHWFGMSQHIRIFLEYCPICRYRRFPNKLSAMSSHVARTDDISDICRKIANIPKDNAEAVPDNLDLTTKDYKEVHQMAEEVKDLNVWLKKNPTIKEEWEYMYQSNSRGAPGHKYKYVNEGKDARVRVREETLDASVDEVNSETIQSYKEYVAELLEAESATSFLKKNCLDKKAVESLLVKDKAIKPSVKTVNNADLPVTVKVIKTNIVSKDNFHQVAKGKDKPEMDNTNDRKEEKDIEWSVDLNESVEETVEQVTVGQNIHASKDEDNIKDDKDIIDNDIVNGKDNTNGDDIKTDNESIGKQKEDNMKIVSGEKEGVGELKTENVVKLEVQESTGAKLDNSTDAEVRKADEKKDESLKHQNESGSFLPRFSRRLKSKADKDPPDVSVKTKQTETKHEAQTVNPEKLDVENEKQKSPATRKISLAQHVQNEHVPDTRSESPVRKSARVRTLNPKYSGYVKSKVVETLAMPTELRVKDETLAIEKIMPDDSHDNQNSAKGMREIQETTLEMKCDTESDEAQKDNKVSKSKTKPIMKMSTFHQGTGIKTAKRLKLIKDKVQTYNEEQRIRPNRKAVAMKSSDIHVKRRSITCEKETQQVEHTSGKHARHSSGTTAKHDNDLNESLGYVINDSINSNLNDIETKNIIVPRLKKGTMTKNKISLVKTADKSCVRKEENKSDRTVCNENEHNKVTDNSNVLRPDRDVVITVRKLLNVKKPCGKPIEEDKLKNKNVEDKEIRQILTDSKSDEKDTSNNKNVKQKEMRQSPTNKVHCQTQSSHPLKYVIDFRKQKTIKAEHSFQEQYSDFVSTTSNLKDAKDVLTDNVSDNSNVSELEINPSFIQDSAVSTKDNEVKENAESDIKGTQVLKGPISQNNIIVSSIEDQFQRTNSSSEEKLVSIIKIKTHPEETQKSEIPDLNIQINENKNLKTSETSDGVNILIGNQESSHDICADNTMMQESVLEEVVGRILECPMCMKIFEDEKAYILHKGMQCNLTCTYCSLMFKSKDKRQFLKHVSRHETGINFQCHDCQKLFLNESLLSIHRRIHTEEGIIECSVCKSRFYSQFDLIAHASAEHATPLVYSCDVCSARYGSKDFLVEQHFSDGALSFYSCALCESNI